MNIYKLNPIQFEIKKISKVIIVIVTLFVAIFSAASLYGQFLYNTTPGVTIIVPQVNDNVIQTGLNDLHTMLESYFISYTDIIASNSADLINIIKDTPKIHVLVLLGHGSNVSFQLSSSLMVSWADLYAAARFRINGFSTIFLSCDSYISSLQPVANLITISSIIDARAAAEFAIVTILHEIPTRFSPTFIDNEIQDHLLKAMQYQIALKLPLGAGMDNYYAKIFDNPPAAWNDAQADYDYYAISIYSGAILLNGWKDLDLQIYDESSDYPCVGPANSPCMAATLTGTGIGTENEADDLEGIYYYAANQDDRNTVEQTIKDGTQGKTPILNPGQNPREYFNDIINQAQNIGNSGQPPDQMSNTIIHLAETLGVIIALLILFAVIAILVASGPEGWIAAGIVFLLVISSPTFAAAGLSTISDSPSPPPPYIYPPTHTIIFTESGISGSISWSLTFNGHLYSSTSSTITISSVPDSDSPYSYSITPIQYAVITPLSGSITVNDVDVNVPITFTFTHYTLTFSQQGKPGGTWSVVVNGVWYSSSGNSISITLVAGISYSYTVSTIYWNRITYYPYPSNGSGTLTSNTNIAITFSRYF